METYCFSLAACLLGYFLLYDESKKFIFRRNVLAIIAADSGALPETTN